MPDQIQTPFHAYITARELSGYSFGKDRLLSVLAASDIEVFPYQIAAAMFALRSPYLKGAVLCDEGSLGKTYEALLVVAQLWFEGKEHILIIVPTPLLMQWEEIMENQFSVPYVVLDGTTLPDEANPFLSEGVVLTTTDYAARNAEQISSVAWDIAVFDEAHRLCRAYAEDGKTASVLREATEGAFRLLLTATPMQNSIMDLYGLIAFIDDKDLPDEKSFYARYFRKPENYPELHGWASRYCFRTMRSQVASYVKIPERLPVTANYRLNAKEQALADLLDAYLKKPVKEAFPKMDAYELTLMLTHTLASSTFALNGTLQGILKRLDDSSEERAQILEMQALAASITENGKGNALVGALKKGFAALKRLGANRKALIFTEMRATQRYICDLLTTNGFSVLSYSGDTSRDYKIMRRFETEADILVATDVAAEGFNLAFCSFVVNYDLPFNALAIEQRILRCHRQGQHSDVFVLNFLSRASFADVRTLELINKRVLQFGGIFGMSDDIVGNFCENAADGLERAIEAAQSKAEIERTYRETLDTHSERNRALVTDAEASLFTSFTREVAGKVTITPQYVKDKAEEINKKLWALTKWFFEGKQGYACIDDTRTVRIGIQPQKVFTGAHLGRREYSMDDTSLPKSARYTITSSLARNILSEIFWKGVPECGAIAIDGLDEPCVVACYDIDLRPKGVLISTRRILDFAGKTRTGGEINKDICVRLLSLPVASWTLCNPPEASDLDARIDAEGAIRRAMTEMDGVLKEEAERLRARADAQKDALGRDIERMRGELRQLETSMPRAANVAEKLKLEKRKSLAQKELKRREQAEFMDGLRIENALEDAMKQLAQRSQLTATVKRVFTVILTPTK